MNKKPKAQSLNLNEYFAPNTKGSSMLSFEFSNSYYILEQLFYILRTLTLLLERYLFVGRGKPPKEKPAFKGPLPKPLNLPSQQYEAGGVGSSTGGSILPPPTTITGGSILPPPTTIITEPVINPLLNKPLKESSFNMPSTISDNVSSHSSHSAIHPPTFSANPSMGNSFLPSTNNELSSRDELPYGAPSNITASSTANLSISSSSHSKLNLPEVPSNYLPEVIKHSNDESNSSYKTLSANTSFIHSNGPSNSKPTPAAIDWNEDQVDFNLSSNTSSLFPKPIESFSYVNVNQRIDVPYNVNELIMEQYKSAQYNIRLNQLEHQRERMKELHQSQAHGSNMGSFSLGHPHISLLKRSSKLESYPPSSSVRDSLGRKDEDREPSFSREKYNPNSSVVKSRDYKVDFDRKTAPSNASSSSDSHKEYDNRAANGKTKYKKKFQSHSNSNPTEIVINNAIRNDNVISDKTVIRKVFTTGSITTGGTNSSKKEGRFQKKKELKNDRNESKGDISDDSYLKKAIPDDNNKYWRPLPSESDKPLLSGVTAPSNITSIHTPIMENDWKEKEVNTNNIPPSNNPSFTTTGTMSTITSSTFASMPSLETCKIVDSIIQSNMNTPSNDISYNNISYSVNLPYNTPSNISYDINQPYNVPLYNNAVPYYNDSNAIYNLNYNNSVNNQDYIWSNSNLPFIINPSPPVILPRGASYSTPVHNNRSLGSFIATDSLIQSLKTSMATTASSSPSYISNANSNGSMNGLDTTAFASSFSSGSSSEYTGNPITKPVNISHNNISSPLSSTSSSRLEKSYIMKGLNDPSYSNMKGSPHSNDYSNIIADSSAGTKGRMNKSNSPFKISPLKDNKGKMKHKTPEKRIWKKESIEAPVSEKRIWKRSENPSS